MSQFLSHQIDDAINEYIVGREWDNNERLIYLLESLMSKLANYKDTEKELNMIEEELLKSAYEKLNRKDEE